MVTNFQLRNGLGVGLFQETIMVFDEEVNEAFETSCINVLLGPVLISFIFGVTSD